MCAQDKHDNPDDGRLCSAEIKAFASPITIKDGLAGAELRRE
jgi:hypothetical protein